MKPVISIGNQDFCSIRENHNFYVDKTGFIKEWWENQDVVTLITRPRRFGKTLTLSMLEYFFSNQYVGRGDLFEGLSVWEEEKYQVLQGSYPVIFVSFANVKGTTYKDTIDGIVCSIAEAYRRHRYFLEGDALSREEKDYFRFFENYLLNTDINKTVSEDSVIAALKELSFFLSRYYGKKVLIFLDEYDTPLQEAYVQGIWDRMTDFVRKMFNLTFKTNPYLERSLMTGITRVSKESIFSDLNNLTVVTTTSEQYRTRFGFTEDEVFGALENQGMPERKEEVKKWYDGFTFGSQNDVYNPWSITNFLKEKVYKPYWANTSSNGLINLLIRQGDAEMKMIVEGLLRGEYLETEVDEEIVFHRLDERRGAVWSLLLASGYLKVAKRYFSKETGRFTYCLKLTNLEVRMMFEDMIRDWFGADDVPYNHFLKALLLNDVDYMNEYMNEVSQQVFSSFDAGKKPSQKKDPERFYHGFVLGLIVELTGKYKVSSNRESGLGRYDVMLEPLDRTKPAYILEFKVRNAKREKTLEDTLQAALKQIKEKGYDRELTGKGIPKGNIWHYGFAFEGKEVLVGGLSPNGA